MAYGDAQARGLIRAVATGLHHSHSIARSEPRLRPTPQLTAMPDSFFSFSSFLAFVLLGPHLRHMEVPRLEV